MKKWDVIVVGAGAAGLIAAIRSAERGLRTLLLEKNAKPGIKILMSGGTRCNITHDTDSKGILKEFGHQASFLRKAIGSFSPQNVIDLVEREGVETKVEPTGKVFPKSDRAKDVLRALIQRLQRTDCELRLKSPVDDIRATGDGFVVITADKSEESSVILLTTGGMSYPGCGTTGDGYAWAKSLGHTIIPPCPALVPITSDSPLLAEVTGITLPDVSLRVVQQQDPTQPEILLAERRGSLLFAHFGVTGPVAMDVSRIVARVFHDDPKAMLSLRCNLIPDTNHTDLAAQFSMEVAKAGKKQVLTYLGTRLPNRLAEAISHYCGIEKEIRMAQVSKATRNRLVTSLTNLPLRIRGTRGFNKAEVTTGGVCLDEVDRKTLQSRLVPNLYFAGEILDIDGPIGGYNFQAAFSTGWLAASSINMDCD